MKLAFLGNTYETTTTEVPTVETGKVISYRGHQTSHRAAQLCSAPHRALTYRGTSYLG